MEFIKPELLAYVEKHTTPESPILKKITRETHLKVLRSRMLSGHLQGRILSLFSHMLSPGFILEIGAYTGYSALCLAEGLRESGRLITIEKNEELEPMIRGFLKEADAEEKIKLLIGDARELIPGLDYTFDLVFIDADKESYLDYYNMILPKMRSGGIMIADNVLWSGKVIEEVKPDDKSAQALLVFNETVTHDDRVENVLFPVRDGLMVIRKK